MRRKSYVSAKYFQVMTVSRTERIRSAYVEESNDTGDAPAPVKGGGKTVCHG